MAAGFGHGEARSRYGRVIRPTSRVKALLADAAEKVYYDSLRRLDDKCNEVKHQIDRNVVTENTVVSVDDWLNLYDELIEAESEFRRQLEGPELAAHDVEYERKQNDYANLQNEMGNFIERRKRMQARSVKSRSLKGVQEMHEQKARLEAQVAFLEQELTQMSIKQEQDTEYKPLVTSTPKVDEIKKPSFELREDVTPNHSSPEYIVTQTRAVPTRIEPADIEVLGVRDEFQRPHLTPTAPNFYENYTNAAPLYLPVHEVGRSPGEREVYMKMPVEAVPTFEQNRRSRRMLAPPGFQEKKPPDPPPDAPTNNQQSQLPARNVPPQTKQPTKMQVKQPEAEDKTAAAILKLADVLSKRDDKLPEKEPRIFSGSIVEFPLWWNSFEMLVEKKTASNSERIYYLDKYTSGEAKKAIAGFLQLFHDDTAYLRARTTLMNRFGNKRRVAEEFRSRLAKQQPVKRYDAKGLQEFADLLWQCHAAMQTINYLSHLETPEENIKLAQKLPFNVMERWNVFIDKHMYADLPDNTRLEEQEENSYPSFVDFCRFVAGEARKAAGPCAGKAPPEKREFNQRRQATTLSTETQQQDQQKTPYVPTCLFCKKSHPTCKCAEFLSKSYDYKKSFASEHALCFGCLKRNHVYRVCRNRNPDLLKENTLPVKSASTLSTGVSGKSEFFSTIIPLTLEHVSDPENKIEIYGILDTQSDSCYVLDEFVEELGVGSKPVNLEITTMNNTMNIASSLVYGLKIRGGTSSYDINLPKCYTKDSIPGNMNSIPTPENVRKWEHLAPMADELQPLRPSRKIGVLIGYNCPAAMFWKTMIEDGEDKPYAMETKLGWVVMGNLNPQGGEKAKEESPPDLSHVCNLTAAKQIDITTKDIKRVFDLEFVESREEKLKRMSSDDFGFMNTVECSINQKENGHFEMDLPFKEEPRNLPNNRGMAMSKLLYLKRKLQKDEVTAERYKKFMDNMIEKGHAEEVKENGIPGKIWYWSHHGVYHPHKLDKLRVVFNGSEIFQGISLNDLLLAGPELINSLVGVLCKFRLDKYAFTCDVEGMFHQVGVTEKDRDFLRFLWFKDGDPNKEIVEYRMTVHLFGASSSPGCANFAFKHVADAYEHQYGKEVADFIRKHFYVDDGLKALPSVKKVVDMFLKGHEMCKQGGFNLIKFQSNSEEAMQQIPEEFRAKPATTYEFKEANAPIERTLGLLWQLVKDVFLFIVKILEIARTRRQMLSQLSSIYDPLGLISPAILPGRNILQELCKAHLKWDEVIPEDLQSIWNAWSEDLENLSKLEIPRCIRSTTHEIKQIHLLHFSDASTVGYGVASYIKVIDVNGNVDVNLYFAKSRVMPNKQVTIPRMELQAAVLAARISAFLTSELSSYDVVNQFWTDSKVVLGYLYNSKKKFQLYVANRVYTILSYSKRDNWHYVESKRNPADLASRGCRAKDLVGKTIWWKGPSFIHDDHTYDYKEQHILNSEDPEIKKEKVLVCSTKVEDEYNITKQLLKLSSWYRMIKVVAVWRRFLLAARTKISKSTTKIAYDTHVINHAEMYQAEHMLFRRMQMETYPEVMDTLTKLKRYPELKCESRHRKSITKYSSNLYKLDVYLDENQTMRVGGRIKRATIPRELIHPVILPKSHPMITAIVRHYHIMTAHGGRGFTLNAIRQAGIWVTNARTAVYSYLKDCVICNRLRKKANTQKMSDLPEERLQEAPPFTYVGVDVFGPFYVKQGRALRKRWICSFNCLTIRAMHTEVLFNLDTSSYINAYRRFIHRRGPCKTIFCDCGTNFKGARSEMETLLASWDVDRIKQETLKDRCDFVEYRFNFPKSSHMGGVWERMIRSIRSSLSYLLSIHGEKLDDELLITTLTEAEAIVNARPLTYVDMSDPYLPPLTPMQLLTMKNTSVLPPPGEFMKEDLYAKKRWRKVQYLANQFWYRWRNEYVHQLQSRSKWEKEEQNIQLGDIVLIVDENLPRNRWIKGMVEKLHPSKDKLVRKVSLKTMNGHLDRPIHKTVLLYRPPEKDEKDQDDMEK